MKTSTIATALALCALTSPAFASPLEERANPKTTTVTATINHTKYKTKTVTEDVYRTKTKTKTVTKGVKTTTILKPTTIVSTLVKPTTVTHVKTASAKLSTVTVSPKGSTVTQVKPTTITLTSLLHGQTVTVPPVTETMYINNSSCTSHTQSGVLPTTSAAKSMSTKTATSTTAAVGSPSNSTSSAAVLPTGYIQVATSDFFVATQCGFVDNSYNNAFAFAGQSNDKTTPQLFSLTSDGYITTGNYTLGGQVDLSSMNQTTFIKGLTADEFSDPSYRPLICSFDDDYNDYIDCTIGTSNVTYDNFGLQEQDWSSDSDYANQNGLYVSFWTSKRVVGPEVHFYFRSQLSDCYW